MVALYDNFLPLFSLFSISVSITDVFLALYINFLEPNCQLYFTLYYHVLKPAENIMKVLPQVLLIWHYINADFFKKVNGKFVFINIFHLL
jgi:hypothetical protein